MKQVMVSKLKAQLSSYLRAVRHGESVLVLDRETPVARLVPCDSVDDGLLITQRSRSASGLKSIQPIKLKRSIDVVRLLRQDRDQR